MSYLKSYRKSSHSFASSGTGAKPVTRSVFDEQFEEESPEQSVRLRRGAIQDPSQPPISWSRIAMNGHQAGTLRVGDKVAFEFDPDEVEVEAEAEPEPEPENLSPYETHLFKRIQRLPFTDQEDSTLAESEMEDAFTSHTPGLHTRKDRFVEPTDLEEEDEEEEDDENAEEDDDENAEEDDLEYDRFRLD